jgi:GntR family transcriptional regulator, transcriptional repressor for pyruvate dehydrogenase complex
MENATGRLISIFKQLISEGSLIPGCRLPAERELAESFGCARSTLRQALKVLEIMGVISQRVGDGTYLNPAADSILGQSMEFLILLDGISFQELMEARLLLEPGLAARAAERATPVEIAELSRLYRAMRDNKRDEAKLVEYDVLFHQAIYRIAGNRVCSVMFTTIHQSVHQLVAVTAQLVDPEHTLLLHRRILSAIRSNDPERTRQRMSEHLQDVMSLVTESDAARAQTRVLSRMKKFSVEQQRPKSPPRSVGRKGTAR